jgi:hypothetical protein
MRLMSAMLLLLVLAQVRVHCVGEQKKADSRGSRLEKFWPIRGPCQNLRDLSD